MSSDPLEITWDQVRSAYDALGLDPDRYEKTTHIAIDPSGMVTVNRLRLPTRANETTEIQIKRPERPTAG